MTILINVLVADFRTVVTPKKKPVLIVQVLEIWQKLNMALEILQTLPYFKGKKSPMSLHLAN
jgi:hypothetical protein